MKNALFWLAYALFTVAFIHTGLVHLREWFLFFENHFNKDDSDKKE